MSDTTTPIIDEPSASEQVNIKIEQGDDGDPTSGEQVTPALHPVGGSTDSKTNLNLDNNNIQTNPSTSSNDKDQNVASSSGDGAANNTGADETDDDKAKDEENDEDEDDEEEEDDIKVTIEDYTTEKQADKQTIQKQPQQAKQAAPAILEANQHIVDINTLEDKPWRKPGADINDYFNYGFDETSWKQYCDHQKQMKNISNEIAEVRNETYRIPVVGHTDMGHRHNNHYNQIPVVPPIVQPVVMHPPRDQHMRDLSPLVEHQSHGRSRRHERQQHQISPPMHQQPSGGGVGRSGRDHRDVSSHRHSRSPHTKERERKHSSSGRSRKDSKSRERRRSRSKEVSSKKRRSRSREREDDRRSKRHKTSRRA